MTDLPTIDAVRKIGTNIRVHGNRFIQVDLDPQGGERLHFWSDHIPLAQDYPTWIHDHVFGFHSRILAGTLVDVRYDTRVAKQDAEIKSTVPIYNVYRAKPREGQDTGLHPTGTVYEVAVSNCQAIIPGYGYTISPLEFHASTYVGYAITRIKKSHTQADVLPRVLCPINALPDNEFERYKYASDHLWQIVENILNVARRERGE